MEKKKKAKVVYSRANHILSQIPLESKYKIYINDSIVSQYHQLVDSTTEQLEKDYSQFKVPTEERFDLNAGYEGAPQLPPDWQWSIVPVRTKIADFIGELEASFELDKPDFAEKFKEKLLKLFEKLTWQAILWIFGIIGAIITAYFLSRFGLK